MQVAPAYEFSQQAIDEAVSLMTEETEVMALDNATYILLLSTGLALLTNGVKGKTVDTVAKVVKGF